MSHRLADGPGGVQRDLPQPLAAQVSSRLRWLLPAVAIEKVNEP
jgi:hypothetical protein